MAARLPAAERRAGLIEAALSVFAAEGFRVATMDTVAAEAGVTKPVLYQHFGSKRELFLELITDVSSRLGAAVTKAIAEAGTPYELTRFGVRAYFDFVAANPDQFRLLFGEGVRSDEAFGAEVRAFELEMARAVANLIDIEGLDDEGRLVLAHGIVGLVEATGRHWVSDPDKVDIDTISDQVTELTWSGLRGRPAASG